jgi:hypothetical protein
VSGSACCLPRLCGDVDRAAVAPLGDLIGDVCEESAGGLVAEHDLRRAPVDAGRARAGGEALGQHRSDPAVLPWVEDGAGDFGPRRIVGHADVAGDANPFPRGRVQGHERLVGHVIDVRQLDELFVSQAIDPLAKPAEAGQSAQAAEPNRELMQILGLDGPDDDLRSVSKPHALTAQRVRRLARDVALEAACSPRVACGVSRGSDVLLEGAKLSDKGGEFALPGTQLTGHGSANVGPTAVPDQRDVPQIGRGKYGSHIAAIPDGARGRAA